MIRRKLLIATAIIASVGTTACSDVTAPSKLIPGGFAAAAIVAPHAGRVTVFARINGGGTAEMQLLDPVSGAGGSGRSMFGMGVTLFSDGSATGDFECVDQHGDATGGGNIFGKVTSWSTDPIDGSIVLQVTGKTFNFPGGPVPPFGGPPGDVQFTVKIQKFGGPGVGHWTLESGGFIYCNETVTSGQLVYRPE
jgi:hypothetical protein